MTFKVGDRVRHTVRHGVYPAGSVSTVLSLCEGAWSGSWLCVNQRKPGTHDPCYSFRASEFELVSPAAIEYDPPRTRNGFMPGDRVRHVDGWTGKVAYTRHIPPDREWVYYDTGCGGCPCPARELTLISDDTGDPPKARKRGPLAAIALQSHAIALQKGFYDDLEYARRRVDDPKVLAFVERLWLMSRCALIHTEVSEMVEAIRDGALAATSKDGKPEGLPSEMADVIIRLADLAGGLGIDLDRAVAEKAAYNTTRKHMHGRKA